MITVTPGTVLELAHHATLDTSSMETVLAKSVTLFANHQIQMEHALIATLATFSTTATVSPYQN
jgi:hypothetical protein